MKKMIFRIVAFILDLLLASVIIYGISNIHFLNPNIVKINHNYALVNQAREKYLEFKEKSKEMLKDAKLSEEEAKEIKNNYGDYYYIFNEVKIGENVENKFITSLDEKIDERYMDLLNFYNYEIQKLSIYENIIAIVIYILYFGVLAYILERQTIFKRFFKLKVVSTENKEIHLWSYIIRSILIAEIILLLADIIGANTLRKESFIPFNYWMSQIKYIYEMVFLVILVLRDDQRSLHDLLLKTKVVRYDKSGNIIDEQIFLDKQEPKKKAEKEFVHAEKVN